jgi:probable rRNA maturation factor
MLSSAFSYDFWSEIEVMSPVRFYYADVKAIPLKNKRIVKEFVGGIFSKEGKDLKLLSYVFCSDGYLLTMNKAFLNHDYFTDIISFDLSEGVGTVGEVYVSVDRVKENAVLHSTTFREEFLRVIFHGALHLCGYQDKKKSEITVMRQKEDYYLRSLHEKFN